MYQMEPVAYGVFIWRSIKLRHAGFQCAGAAFIGRDQRDGGLDGGPLFRGEEGRLVIVLRCGVRGRDRRCRCRQRANAAATTAAGIKVIDFNKKSRRELLVLWFDMSHSIQR